MTPSEPAEVVRPRESIPEPVNTMSLAELVYWENRRAQDRWSVLQRRLNELERKIDELAGLSGEHAKAAYQTALMAHDDRARLEAKVDRIIVAMKAQGLGMWGKG